MTSKLTQAWKTNARHAKSNKRKQSTLLRAIKRSISIRRWRSRRGAIEGKAASSSVARNHRSNDHATSYARNGDMGVNGASSKRDNDNAT